MEKRPPEYLTLKQTADILGIPIKTLRGWMFQKKFPLPFNKLGGKLLIRKTALENHLKKTEVKQTA